MTSTSGLTVGTRTEEQARLAKFKADSERALTEFKAKQGRALRDFKREQALREGAKTTCATILEMFSPGGKRELG